MSDITERLRDAAWVCEEQPNLHALLTEADAEIERLRGEVARERALLALYREAVRIDVMMEGPKFAGSNASALKRAWDYDVEITPPGQS